MKKLLTLSILPFFFSCQSWIKNDSLAEEHTVKIPQEIAYQEPEINEDLTMNQTEDFLGYWVGFFEADESLLDTSITNKKDYYLDRMKKITFSIDKISKDSVFGHSVVGAIIRPFSGTLNYKDEKYTFNVNEPGDDKYDGEFILSIAKNDSVLKGRWTANEKGNFIHTRTAELQKRLFKYDPEIQLEDAYIDYSKQNPMDSLNSKQYIDSMNLSDEEEAEEYGIYNETYYSTTEAIFNVNPSTQILSKEQVENLTKADIFILRNLIFARHGYAFKDKKLRQYFGYQDWYMPVYGDISDEITEIEKENIDLLLRYEANAREYYDYFGR